MPDIHFMFRDHYKNEDFTFEPPVNGWPRACLNDSVLQLVRLNADESDYSPYGDYRATTCILPRYYAQGLTGIYAFKDLRSGDGTIGYQFSNDGGLTWLTYDSGWVPAIGALENTYISVETADANIQTFPITEDKSFRIKVYLEPGNGGKSTPELHQIIASMTLDYDYQDDFLKSLMIHLENNMRVRVTLFADITNSNIATPEHQWDGFLDPIEVYNLTTDPNRTTNIYNGLYNNGFELTSKQTGRIEINAYARPTVFISAPEAWMELSKNPAVIINDNQIQKMGEFSYGEDEIEYHFSEFKARKSPSRVYYRINSTISVQSSLKHVCEALSDALERALNQYQYIHSYGSGEYYKVLSPTPITLSNRVAIGLFTKDYSSTIFGRAWLRPDLIHEVDLVQRIRYFTNVNYGENPVFEEN